ncbi:RNA 2',3'-cyclic phosphodiesterase [Candidatus Woesearchaeota archaeon]|nr:MAG: RNA 2',3'-cyclic phosphodiesterase [Candidatus Woesearchaeota archaeon]
MRLFIAIEVAGEAARILKEVQESLPPSVKKTKEFHITLKFLGETESWQDIDKSMRNLEFEKFSITINDIGAFPNQKFPRVIWAGISESKELLNLKRDVDSLIRNFKDDKPFHPHITLARTRRETRIDFETLRKILLKGSERSVLVNSVFLFKSTLTPEGPVYTKLAEHSAKDF